MSDTDQYKDQADPIVTVIHLSKWSLHIQRPRTLLVQIFKY